jgi:hypothetical protein
MGMCAVAAIFGDRAGGLKAIEVGHDHIHQDQVRQSHAWRPRHAKRAVLGGDDLVAQLVDDLSSSRRVGTGSRRRSGHEPWRVLFKGVADVDGF